VRFNWTRKRRRSRKVKKKIEEDSRTVNVERGWEEEEEKEEEEEEEEEEEYGVCVMCVRVCTYRGHTRSWPRSMRRGPYDTAGRGKGPGLEC